MQRAYQMSNTSQVASVYCRSVKNWASYTGAVVLGSDVRESLLCWGHITTYNSYPGSVAGIKAGVKRLRKSDPGPQISLKLV